MKKKGFTLVELLGVMTVLGIIALLIIPAVEKTISNSKKKGLENQKNTIISGAKSWMTDNKELVEDDEVIVTVGDLKQEGYLEFNIKNPVTNKCISNNTEVLITIEGKKYKYKINGSIIDGEDGECGTINAKPNLYLMGRNPISIKQGESFKDPGFSATTINGDDISRRVVISGEVDTSTIGEYIITYTITDNGLTSVKKRKVKVLDEEDPYISHPGTTVLLDTDTSFNALEDVYVVDNSGESINVKAVTDLTLGIKGEYKVTYYAEDSSGNEMIDTRRIIVKNDNTNTIYNKIKDSTETYPSDYLIKSEYEDLEFNEHLKGFYRNRKFFLTDTSKNWVRIKDNLYRIIEFSNDAITLLYKKKCTNDICEGYGSITDDKFYFLGKNDFETKWNSTKNEVKRVQEKWVKEQEIDEYLTTAKQLTVFPILASQVSIYENYYELIYCEMVEEAECTYESFIKKGLMNYSNKYITENKFGILGSDIAYNNYLVSSELEITSSLLSNDDPSLEYPNIYTLDVDFSIYDNLIKLFSDNTYTLAMIGVMDEDGFMVTAAPLELIDIEAFEQYKTTFHTVINVKPELTVSQGTGTETDPYVLIP